MSIQAFNNNSVAITSEGGMARRYINKIGVNSVKGKLVKFDSANDNSVILTGANDTEFIGVFYEDGIPDGSLVWVVREGDAQYALNDNIGSTAQDWLGCGEAGYAISQNSPAASPTHFQEVGHSRQTVSAGGVGTHQLVLGTINKL